MHPFPTSFSIGPLKIAPATVLAPMAGVTDTVFRRFIRNLGGCGLIMTEFTSSHGVSASMGARKPTKTLTRYLHFEPDEHPISAQLFGADPRVMADAARVCQDLGLRHPRHQFRLPGQQGGQVQRRLRPAPRPAAGGTASAHRTGGHLDSLHDEVPRRLERRGTGGRARWRGWRRTAVCRRSRCIPARASRATAARPTGLASPR